MKIVDTINAGGAIHDLNMALSFEGFEPRESFSLRGYRIVPLPYPHALVEESGGLELLSKMFSRAATNAGFLVERGFNNNIDATIPVEDKQLTVSYNPMAGSYHFLIGKRP